MPIGPYPDFAACAAAFADDPDIDDPGAFCQYLEEREQDSSDAVVIYGLDVQYMSLVDSPAVGDSAFLKSKGLKAKDRFGRQMKSKSSDAASGRGMFLKSELDDANYIVKAAALVPDKTDLNGEAIRKEDIYKAAVKFMEYQKVDSQHDFIDGKGKVVFNWILDTDETKILMDNTPKSYPAGTWMVGVKINDPKEWDLIKTGKRRGFSIAGYWSGAPLSGVPGTPVTGEKARGPGGHTPDGTGPHGSGSGPGNGNSDGSGMDDDDNDDNDDNQPKKTTEGIDMDDDQLKELLEGHKKALMDAQSEFLTAQKNESEALVKAMSESNEAHVKAMSDISEAVKSLADAVAAKAEDPASDDEDEDEDEEKSEKSDKTDAAPPAKPDPARKTTASEPIIDLNNDEADPEDINAYIKSYQSPLKVKRSEPCN